MGWLVWPYNNKKPSEILDPTGLELKKNLEPSKDLESTEDYLDRPSTPGCLVAVYLVSVSWNIPNIWRWITFKFGFAFSQQFVNIPIICAAVYFAFFPLNIQLLLKGEEYPGVGDGRCMFNVYDLWFMLILLFFEFDPRDIIFQFIFYSQI